MDVLSREIKESISVVSKLASKLPKRVEMIKKELELCRQEINDINHTIEMTNANAYQGWKLYKDLQITLQKRRELKDELAILEDLAGNFKSKDIFASHANKASLGIKAKEEVIKARTYSVRVRKDLINQKNIVVR